MRSRKINSKMSRKLIVMFLAVVVALVALAVRISYINATEGEQYERIVMTQAQQQYDSRTIPFQRGDITDRNGTLLATSEKVYNVILDCKVTNTEVEELDGTTSQKYLEPTIEALVSVLGMDEEEIRGILTADETKNSQYQVLQTGLSITEKKAFEAYTDTDSEENASLSEEELEARENVKGVWFEEDYVRTYPLDSLASDVIGFTYDGTTADWGIEGYYSDILNGTNGRQYGYFNTDADVEQTIIPAVAGKNIVSTIDSNIQQIIRNALENYEEEMADDEGKTNGAENIGVIVMDPNTGEILGMDSDRWYDLNNPRDLTTFYTEEEIDAMDNDSMMDALNAIWGNFCISDAYELGSVFKPFTIAAGLSTGVINTETKLVCDGGQQVDDYYIACESVHGEITIDQALQYSCNDALMQIAALLGEDEFLKYNDTFNFGMKTGIDLPGESSGQLFTTDTMGGTELATSSFGQGFTATMIQEVSAICSVINGGYYYKPHIVKEITDENGAVVESFSSTLSRRTVSEEVSATIREAMGEVMESDGTGYTVKIPGYTMGGKTGTAEKLPRDNGEYVLSFVGFAPLDDPQVVVYVVVDEPNADNQEPTVYATSIARNIFTELLPYMNIFPDEEGYTAADIDTTLATNEILLNKYYTTYDNGIIIQDMGQGSTISTSSADSSEESAGIKAGDAVVLADNGLVDTDGDGVGDAYQSEVDADLDGYVDSDYSSDSSGGSTDTSAYTEDESYLYLDTTTGTAEDGSDLPTVDQTENTTEYGNDYFSDGYTNSDLESY